MSLMRRTAPKVGSPKKYQGLWEHLKTLDVIAFGRTPLELPERPSDRETLPFYRARKNQTIGT
jgi:hypothetical protein